jgi:hypothetical protein
MFFAIQLHIFCDEASLFLRINRVYSETASGAVRMFNEVPASPYRLEMCEFKTVPSDWVVDAKSAYLDFLTFPRPE